jgi:hypothetical protein
MVMRVRKKRRVVVLERRALELEMGERRKGQKDRNRMGQQEETDKEAAVVGHHNLTRPLLLRVLELIKEVKDYNSPSSPILIPRKLERTWLSYSIMVLRLTLCLFVIAVNCFVFLPWLFNLYTPARMRTNDVGWLR